MALEYELLEAIRSRTIVSLRLRQDRRAVVDQLRERGLDARVAGTDEQIVKLCVDYCPALIVADLYSWTGAGPARALAWFPDGQPLEAGILFVAEDSVVPTIPEAFSGRFVGWMHRGVGPSALANLAAAVLIQRLQAIRYRSLATTEEGEAEGVYLTARYHQLLGDLGAAEDLFRRALAIAPEHAEAHRCLGNLLVQQRRHADALDHLVAATTADGADQAALEALALVLQHLGRDLEAEAVRMRAADLDG